MESLRDVERTIRIREFECLKKLNHEIMHAEVQQRKLATALGLSRFGEDAPISHAIVAILQQSTHTPSYLHSSARSKVHR
jgi:hypothetical protein